MRKSRTLAPCAVFPALAVALYIKEKDPSACTPLTYHGPDPVSSGMNFWPHMHGPTLDGHTNFSAFQFEKIGGAENWSWHHPQGRFHTVLNGVVIDAAKNLYITGDDFVRKFSPDGVPLWTHCSSEIPIPNAPALAGHKVIASTARGSIFALDMSTGEVVWRTKVGDNIGYDTHSVATDNGDVVIAPEGVVQTEAGGIAGGARLHGLRLSDGQHLWTFQTDLAVWNFHAVFPGDGSFLFQDLEGRAYRNELKTGQSIWKRGGVPGTWTDGSMGIGPGGLVYAVSNNGPNAPFTRGTLSAYRIDDGELVWAKQLPHPANQFPAVGSLGGNRPPSVVVAVGVYTPTKLFVFDAATGATQWEWNGPPMIRSGAAGDQDGLATRLFIGAPRSKCLPNAWSNPSIDGAGRIFIGHNNGEFLALQDVNLDGKHVEVSRFNAKAGFPGSGPALAPNMAAIVSCDGLFVFKSH